jgi:mono/diheme cytochrome c family protein
MNHRVPLALLAPLVFGACIQYVPDMPPPITEPQTLGGKVVDVATLQRGREGYMLYCYACHGIQGDGNGPATYGLRPPPRAFGIATFKFAGVAQGLPHDEDLLRIVKGGLNGTPMLQWDIPDKTVLDIIQYIKTFSPEGEGWRDPDAELGERIVPGADPWAGKEEEAIERGSKVYHGVAGCWSCHPAYVSRAEIALATWETKKQLPPPGSNPPEYRKGLYRSELKETQYTVKKADGSEYKVKVLPPDFMLNPLRSAWTVGDLYRTLASGIGGTAMPAWKGALPEEDIWAMAHYVKHLTGWAGSAKVGELKARLDADKSPVQIPDAPPPAPEGAPAPAP